MACHTVNTAITCALKIKLNEPLAVSYVDISIDL